MEIEADLAEPGTFVWMHRANGDATSHRRRAEQSPLLHLQTPKLLRKVGGVPQELQLAGQGAGDGPGGPSEHTAGPDGTRSCGLQQFKELGVRETERRAVADVREGRARATPGHWGVALTQYRAIL